MPNVFCPQISVNGLVKVKGNIDCMVSVCILQILPFKSVFLLLGGSLHLWTLHSDGDTLADT